MFLGGAASRVWASDGRRGKLRAMAIGGRREAMKDHELAQDQADRERRSGRTPAGGHCAIRCSFAGSLEDTPPNKRLPSMPSPQAGSQPAACRAAPRSRQYAQPSRAKQSSRPDDPGRAVNG